MFWQINDCWPVASWSSVDYYGCWKALHYFTRKAYEPVHIIPHKQDGYLEIYVVSDKLIREEGRIQIRLIDFSGVVLNEIFADVQINPQSSLLVFQKKIKEILDGNSERNAMLIVNLQTERKIISQNLYYFTEVKELKLPKVNITKEIEKTEFGYDIKLKSDKLAKNVYIFIEEYNGFLSDNYFDMLPGEEYIIEFRTSDIISHPENEIELISVRDTY
jgi:beta-mannosidase